MGLDVASLLMALYSLLLMAVLVLGAPYWLARMVGSGRYRAGLGQRLGRVPAELRIAVAGRQVVWVHAVSVGEVLAATRLVAELEAVLGDDWAIVVSTTTSTGQALARERFAAGPANKGRVFYYPLDFAWALRAYLRALQPKLLVLMESELWPRMLVECNRSGIPVAVVNARVSDKSFARGVRVRAVWGMLVRRVDLFLAQSEEDARRLVVMGARAGSVLAVGNLKYDVLAPKASRIAELIKDAAAGRRVLVGGSTIDGDPPEELPLIGLQQSMPKDERPLLVLAPRRPENFDIIYSMAVEFPTLLATEMLAGKDRSQGFCVKLKSDERATVEIVVLDTIGDLAAVYGVADVAFVGGSLVKRGGHNPLEPAQFGVPVVMGPSYENFRDIVGKMHAADGICIVQDKDELQAALVELLTDREKARAMGERGRWVFAEQQGATARTVDALVGLVKR
jgi:3-deoxy-D-manno-octulosonic-acid transferase